MIIYNLRKPIETNAGNSVGVTGENNSYTARFLIRELADDSLEFSIHLRFSDGSINTVVPDEVTVDDNGTAIVWNVKKNDIFVHGFFEMQIEGRNSDGYIFQTEIVRMFADESIPVEDKEYENPNSETLKLREEAYNFLCELKLQQDRLDENMKLLLATDITKKQDAEFRVSDKSNVTDETKNYPSIKYLNGNYYDISDVDASLALKADNSTLVSGCEGMMTFAPYSKFLRAGTRGKESTDGEPGTLNTDIKYRVTSEDIMKFDYDLNVSVDEGFTAYVVKYADGTYESIKSLSDTNGYIIPANTEFRLHIRRTTENPDETADINEFVNAVKFQTKLSAEVDLKADRTEVDAVSQIISEEVKNITILNRTETHTAKTSVGIRFNFNAGETYIIEYNSSLPVERILNCLTNSYSSSQIVEEISAPNGATSGTIIYTATKSGGKYIVFTSSDKLTPDLTITGQITASLKEKVNIIGNEVGAISDVIKKNVYDAYEMSGTHGSGFITFPFEFAIGKTYQISFSADKEIDYIYNMKDSSISSSQRAEIIASPNLNSGTVTYTPSAEGGQYIALRCADRDADLTVNGSITFSVADMINSINRKIENIKESETNDGIPDYYYADNYITDKINEIKQNCNILNGVTFAFVTDMHFKVNQKQSKKLLKKIMDETNIPFVIFGGDLVYMYGTEEELNEQVAEFNSFKSYVGKNNLFCTRGNHDLYNREPENLFNFNEWADALQAYSKPVWNGTLVSVDKNNETLTFSSTGGDCYTVHGVSNGVPIFKIPVKPSTSYSLSFKQEGTQGLTFVFFNGSTASGQMVSADSSKGKLNFTTKEDTEYITLRFGINRSSPSGSTATVSDIKLLKADNSLTTADVYDTFFRDSERSISNMSIKNGCYCIDNEVQKTRIIMLNTSDLSNSPDNTGGGVQFRASTLEWLSNALTEKTGYKIIIVSHTPLNYETFGNDNSSDNPDGLQQMIAAFKNKTTFTTTRFDVKVNADFTETTNELICVISGHRHIDGYSVENNVLNIVTTCDCIDSKDGYGRKAGTINEQAIDVYCINYDTRKIKTVRVGAGENRNFTYQ